MDPLKEWLNGDGAAGLDHLELTEFPVTGRGIRTKRAIKSGDRIMTIPNKSLWTVKHAHEDPLLGPILQSASPPLSSDDTLAVYLLFVRAQESGYGGLKSHLAAIPESYSSSIFFSDEELQVCSGSSLHTLTTQLRKQVEDSHKDLCTRVFIPNKHLFPLEKFTLDHYKWSLCTLWSRGMDFSISEGNSIRLLAPFADMVNHSSDVNQCHAYDPNSGDLSIYASKDYHVDDQVFIYYGPVSNSKLLRLYGFVIPNNPHDSYDLVLSTHPSAPFYDQKQRFWAAAGLEETSTIPLTVKNPLPESVLRYLRIQRCDSGDFATVAMQQIDGKYTKLSDINETQILHFLVNSFGSLLSGFGTSLETLEKQLNDGTYAVGSNSWAAAHVSEGEQRLLKLAKTKAEGLLAAVRSGGNKNGDPSKCANCGEGSGTLSLCSRCKSVRYCGRPCQVAHFKAHKQKCLATASR